MLLCTTVRPFGRCGSSTGTTADEVKVRGRYRGSMSSNQIGKSLAPEQKYIESNIFHQESKQDIFRCDLVVVQCCERRPVARRNDIRKQ
jgi:hypothetical protein